MEDSFSATGTGMTLDRHQICLLLYLWEFSFDLF